MSILRPLVALRGQGYHSQELKQIETATVPWKEPNNRLIDCGPIKLKTFAAEVAGIYPGIEP